MEEDDNKLSREQILSALTIVREYLTTRKGLIYVVYYAGASVIEDNEENLRLPQNAIYTTGKIEDALARFFITQKVVKACLGAEVEEQELSTVITGEIVASNLDVEDLYIRALKDPITLLFSVIQTDDKKSISTVVLQAMKPESPIKTEDTPYSSKPYNGVLN